jgi:hypothetical protein
MTNCPSKRTVGFGFPSSALNTFPGPARIVSLIAFLCTAKITFFSQPLSNLWVHGLVLTAGNPERDSAASFARCRVSNRLSAQDNFAAVRALPHASTHPLSTADNFIRRTW